MSDISGPSGDLVASLVSLVERGGAKVIPRRRYEHWPPDAVAMEDNYSIIAFWPFDGVAAMLDGWGEAQEALSELVSSALPATDSKAWETYLVLCVAESVPPYFQSRVNQVRSDMQRSRKLIVSIETSDDGLSSIPRSIRLRRAVAPLVGLQVENIGHVRNPIDGLLGKIDLSEGNRRGLETAIASYELGRPIVESIHLDRLRGETGGSSDES